MIESIETELGFVIYLALCGVIGNILELWGK